MKKIVKYIKLFIWSIVIAYLCFAPADEFKKVHISIPHFDKVVHFGMFFILGIIISAIKYSKPSKFNTVWLPTIAIAYGGVIEIIQLHFIYKRNGDLIDWLADIIGLFMGIWLFGYLPKKIQNVLI